MSASKEVGQAVNEAVHALAVLIARADAGVQRDGLLYALYALHRVRLTSTLLPEELPPLYPERRSARDEMGRWAA